MEDGKRLKWLCRRGTRELDKLLGDFLQAVYPSLAEADQQRFADLLQWQDPVLQRLLLGQEKLTDKAHQNLIDAIRRHAGLST